MLTIRISKRKDGGGVLRCVRADGSETWQKQESRHAAFFALHDLTHFAVESALGYYMNPLVVDRLRAAAETAKVAVQWGASGRGTGTDANAIQLSRGGVAAGLVSIPNRYMHSAVEMISLNDIDQAADLLAEFALAIGADADFTPK